MLEKNYVVECTTKEETNIVLHTNKKYKYKPNDWWGHWKYVTYKEGHDGNIFNTLTFVNKFFEGVKYETLSFKQWQELFNKSNKEMKTQTLTREQLIGLKSVSDCGKWNDTINDILKCNMYNTNNDFEIRESALSLLMNKGNPVQIKAVSDLGIILPQSEQEIYLENHNKSGFVVGDMVKLLKIAKSGENGWVYNWNKSAMDKYVEEVLTIFEDRGTMGFRCKSKDGLCYVYPYFVLEKVVEEYVPFDFNDDLIGKVVIHRDAKLKGIIFMQEIDMVQVSDKTYSYSQLKQFYTFLDGSPCGKLKS